MMADEQTAAESLRRTALVTGGCGGIGTAITVALADAGFDVAVIDTAHPPEEVASRVAHYRGSVTDEAFVRTSIDAFLGDGDGLDVLVNGAGLMQRAKFGVEDLAAAVRVVDVNLVGLMTVTHVALPWLHRAADGASIINIGSIWATNVWPERSVYSATKAAVEHFTRCLETDLRGTSVHAYCVSPGLVRTTFTDDVAADDSFLKPFTDRLGATGFLQPEDIASVVLDTLSRPMSYASGAPIFIHGGFA